MLNELKLIESRLGRVANFRNGPRPIDLDILFYDNHVVNQNDLQIPHPRISERNFVLFPLRDLDPNLKHPITGETIIELVNLLPLNSKAEIRKVAPVGKNLFDTTRDSKKVIMMGILNATPDRYTIPPISYPVFLRLVSHCALERWLITPILFVFVLHCNSPLVFYNEF